MTDAGGTPTKETHQALIRLRGVQHWKSVRYTNGITRGDKQSRQQSASQHASNPNVVGHFLFPKTLGDSTDRNLDQTFTGTNEAG